MHDLLLILGVLMRQNLGNGGNMKHDKVMACCLAGILAASGLTGCSTYENRVAPIPLPSAQRDHVEVDGVLISARAYLNEKEAKDAFGFDARGAGILPVQLVLDNRSGQEVTITPNQTFLIDTLGQAWPLLQSQQLYDRVGKHVDIAETGKGSLKPAVLAGAAGALAGLAIGVVSGRNVGSAAGTGAVIGATAGAIAGGATSRAELDERLRQDLSQKTLKNRSIKQGDLAYGALFFPGFAEEIQGIVAIRLSLHIGSHDRIVEVPLR